MPEEQKDTQPFSWGAHKAILASIAIFFLSQIVAVVVLSVYVRGQHWSQAQANQWLDSSVVAQFFFVLLVESVTIGLLYGFISRYKTTFKDLGVRWPRLIDVGYALTGFAIYLPLYLMSLGLIHFFVPGLNIDQKQQLGFDTASGHTLVLVFISLVILPPIVEEILVRGFLYGSLRTKWPKIQAALVASALFAAAHLQIGSGAPLLWVAAIDTFILSLVLIYLRNKTGGLAASMMLHMLKNGVAFVALFLIGTR